MSKTVIKLKEHGLYEDEHTMTAKLVSECDVYGITEYPGFLVSGYDFVRNKKLPEHIWSVSKMEPDGCYQIHVTKDMLTTNNQTILWAAKMLTLQMYLKKELDE